MNIKVFRYGTVYIDVKLNYIDTLNVGLNARTESTGRRGHLERRYDPKFFLSVNNTINELVQLSSVHRANC